MFVGGEKVNRQRIIAKPSCGDVSLKSKMQARAKNVIVY